MISSWQEIAISFPLCSVLFPNSLPRGPPMITHIPFPPHPMHPPALKGICCITQVHSVTAIWTQLPDRCFDSGNLCQNTDSAYTRMGWMNYKSKSSVHLPSSQSIGTEYFQACVDWRCMLVICRNSWKHPSFLVTHHLSFFGGKWAISHMRVIQVAEC